MLPPTRQRLLISAAIAVSVLAWLGVRGWLVGPDLSEGISLTSAAAGMVGAIVAVVFAGAISVGAGLLPGAAGHPLSGVFAAGIGLCALAGWGGPIDGWMRRVSLPGGYVWLIVETLVWHAGVLAAVVVTWKWRASVRRMLPGMLLDERHEAVEMPGRFELTAVLSGVVAALVGGVVTWVLMRSTSEGQVIGTLIAAFTLGGLAAHTTFPNNRHVGPILVSPAVVAIVAYALAMVMCRNEATTLAAWFNLNGLATQPGRMPGPALVLPIYYASAGVVGTAMGIGIAESIHVTREHGSATAT